MGFDFSCGRCGKPGSVPDSAVTPHADENVTVILPPGWFASEDSVACLDCVEPERLRAWVREQCEVAELEELWDR